MPALQYYLSLAIAAPLSELEQKTDSLCLPKLWLLSFAIAKRCCKQIAIRKSRADLIGNIGTYNGEVGLLTTKKIHLNLYKINGPIFACTSSTKLSRTVSTN
jgi:hypothetical protein